MRRWMHILLIGLLIVGLSIDSASACRGWRRGCRRSCDSCFEYVECHEFDCREADPCGQIAEGSCCGAVVVESSREAVAAPSVVTPPAPEPAFPEQPKSVDAELFDSQPSETPPTEDVPPESAASDDDLFGDEKAEPAPPEESLPPQEPVPATETPQEEPFEEDDFEEEEQPAIPETPDEEPAATQPEPQAEPVEQATLEEEPLPAEEPGKTEDEEENLFGEETEEPAKSAPSDSPADDEEDLFGDDEPGEPPAAPAVDEPAQEPPVEEPKGDAPKEDADEEDPFAGVVPTPDEPLRTWIDDTGRYRTVARLVEVRPEGVRLLKADGRLTLVPLSRLSDHDRLYTGATAARLGLQLARQARPGDTAGL